MNNIQKLYTQAAQAVDTTDLLDHLAWTEVLEPALKKYRDQISTELYTRILNRTIDPNSPTIEQLAGKVAGIDWVFTLLKRILREGGNAKNVLRELDINVE
jgi:hypothetical protein